MRRSDRSVPVIEFAQMTDDLFKAYELYLTDRTRLASAKVEAAKSYDQTILTFSAGAVALSITFLEKLIQRPAVTWLLYVAWILFGVAILATLYSLLASQRACADEICTLDEQFRELAGITEQEAATPPETAELSAYGKTMAWLRKFADLFSPRATVFGIIVRVLNWLAGLFFFLGIVCFALFAKENWATMKPLTDEAAAPSAVASRVRMEDVSATPVTHTSQPSVQSPLPTNTVGTMTPTTQTQNRQ
jgi:hypothetical protein